MIVDTNALRSVLQDKMLGTYGGKVMRVTGSTIESIGPVCTIGDLCSISSPNSQENVVAEVIGIENDKVTLMPYDSCDGIGHGSKVVNLNNQLSIPLGNALIGRIIDPLGNPLDGKGPINVTQMGSVKGQRTNPINRPRIEQPLPLGIKAIDACLSIGQGQRVGIFSGSGVGKSTLLGMIARNVVADLNVIALIGERGREVNEFIQKDLKVAGLSRSILVVATSDQSAIMRSKCALTATSIAEYFKNQGLNVLLMMDSLTRFAMAQREIGLSIGEAPIARGYTPSIYSELPKLLERAGRFHEGSITGLYTVLVEGDDTNEPISDTVRGILDGHIVLSRKIAMKHHYPAIDILSSLSRLMHDICEKSVITNAGRLRELLSVLAENEDLVSIGAYKAGSNPLLDEALKKNTKITKFLTQAIDEAYDFKNTQKLLDELVKS